MGSALFLGTPGVRRLFVRMLNLPVISGGINFSLSGREQTLGPDTVLHHAVTLLLLGGSWAYRVPARKNPHGCVSPKYRLLELRRSHVFDRCMRSLPQTCGLLVNTMLKSVFQINKKSVFKSRKSRLTTTWPPLKKTPTWPTINLHDDALGAFLDKLRQLYAFLQRQLAPNPCLPHTLIGF